jgi:hypothetical protein
MINLLYIAAAIIIIFLLGYIALLLTDIRIRQINKSDQIENLLKGLLNDQTTSITGQLRHNSGRRYAQEIEIGILLKDILNHLKHL